MQKRYHDNDLCLRPDLDIDWTHGTVSCWCSTNRKYVDIGACLSSNVSLLGVRCTITPSRLRICLLFTCTTMAMTYMALCGCRLNIRNGVMWVLTEQQVRWYRFMFGCVIAWYTMHLDTITIAFSPDMQLQWQWHTALRWCWLHICHGIVAALTEQRVRCYQFMFDFWLCHYLVYDATWHHRDCTLVCL